VPSRSAQAVADRRAPRAVDYNNWSSPRIRALRLNSSFARTRNFRISSNTCASPIIPTCMRWPNSSDGKLYVSKTYLKASGGCSAPRQESRRSQKPDRPDAYRQFGRGDQGLLRGARKVDHDSATQQFRLQMDQVTQLYIPVLLHQRIAPLAGRQPSAVVEAGFLISETPISASPTSRRRRSAFFFAGEAMDTQWHVSSTNGMSTLPHLTRRGPPRIVGYDTLTSF